MNSEDVMTTKDFLKKAMPDGFYGRYELEYDEEDSKYCYKGWEIKPVITRKGIAARKSFDPLPPYSNWVEIEGPYRGVLENIDFIEYSLHAIEELRQEAQDYDGEGRRKKLDGALCWEAHLRKQFESGLLFFWWDEDDRCYRIGRKTDDD